jgi:hypothetical protein
MGCWFRFYCDKVCFKRHWKHGGHKDECGKLQAEEKTAALGTHGPDPALAGAGGGGGGGSGSW